MKEAEYAPLPDDQMELCELNNGWEQHWRGMPEFEQVKQVEYAKITVRFRNQQDLDDFSKRIGQTLNRNSQCTWHPELPPVGSGPKLRWRDET